ncbi:3'-5' exonuclease [Allostreptomyces psammosilenae]|uniref:DNA polymerase III epsilon subunit-like protein n=1 Tax=Allostreptomyces psammosilenae TaxID=1892865 RepID=A0A853A4Y6_9ACTN|nr:3'-5' exonuclease [Allostreptomyces psammosilenae]NYI05761.1 DNA polymerase III epsilon subunit-like protein [Allostreptomyces psammosilenae]
MRSQGYAVVDLETTGSSPWRHRIVEVGVVLMDADARPQGEFETLLCPDSPVGPTHIHGIRQQDVTDAPAFADVAPHLLRLLRGRVFVAHNARCDLSFLAREYERLDIGLPEVPWLCTMRMAELHLPPLPAPSLTACRRAAGLPAHRAHTALGDARATAELFRRYAAMYPSRPVAWGGLLRRAAGMRWPEEGWAVHAGTSGAKGNDRRPPAVPRSGRSGE